MSYAIFETTKSLGTQKSKWNQVFRNSDHVQCAETVAHFNQICIGIGVLGNEKSTEVSEN